MVIHVSYIGPSGIPHSARLIPTLQTHAPGPQLLWVESQLVCHVDRLSSQDVANALACLARLADSQRPGASEQQQQQQQPGRGRKQPQMTAGGGGGHRAGSHAPPQPQKPDNTSFGAAPVWARQGHVHGQQQGTVSGGGGGASAGAGRDVGQGRPGEDAIVGRRGGTGRGGVRPQPATLVALLRRCAVVVGVGCEGRWGDGSGLMPSGWLALGSASI